MRSSGNIERVTYRARFSKFLGESTSLGDGCERAGSAAIVRERLHIHRGSTVVVYDGILGRDETEERTNSD